MKYKSGDTIPQGAYKGFVIIETKKGWFRGYFPSNVTPTYSISDATTSIRWSWV